MWRGFDDRLEMRCDNATIICLHLRFYEFAREREGDKDGFLVALSTVCVGERVSAVDWFFDSQMHVMSASCRRD